MKEEKIILKGIPASQGMAVGEVKLIKDSLVKKFKKGSILVAEITNPSMTQIMAKSKAIITDFGGITSHPAIIARELGIPCIVSTLKATKVLKNNQKIKVDGTKGFVYKI